MMSAVGKSLYAGSSCAEYLLTMKEVNLEQEPGFQCCLLPFGAQLPSIKQGKEHLCLRVVVKVKQKKVRQNLLVTWGVMRPFNGRVRGPGILSHFRGEEPEACRGWTTWRRGNWQPRRTDLHGCSFSFLCHCRILAPSCRSHADAPSGLEHAPLAWLHFGV